MSAKEANSRRIYSRCEPIPYLGCWIWTGTIATTGYGVIKFDRKQYLAHRLSYETFKGSIPEGLQLDHLCRNRDCVNPDHLEPVTIKENLRRGLSRYGQRAHCHRGHEYTTENTKIYRGYRLCLICQYINNQNRKFRK